MTAKKDEKEKMEIVEVGFVRDLPCDSRLGVWAPAPKVVRDDRNNLRRGPGSKFVFDTSRGRVNVPMSAVAYWVEKPVE